MKFIDLFSGIGGFIKVYLFDSPLINQMGNKYTKIFVCDKETLSKMYEDKQMTQREIANELRVSQKVIWRMMRDYGIKARIPKNTKQERSGKGYYCDQGYKYIKLPDHPNAQKNGYVAEHIFIASNKLGRPINTKKEIVHHIDGNKGNNVPENLFISNKSKHRKIHYQLESFAFELVEKGDIIFEDGNYRWK